MRLLIAAVVTVSVLGCKSSDKDAKGKRAPVQDAAASVRGRTPAPGTWGSSGIAAKPRADAGARAKRTVPKATEFRFDGIRLGDPYAAVKKRAPYRASCSAAALDASKSTRAVLYGGFPCPGKAFPQDTSLALLTAGAGGKSRGETIDALIWMGGDYFRKRTEFPVHTGFTIFQASQVLGMPTKQFRIGVALPLMVHKHYDDIFVIVHGDLVAGIAVGRLSDVPTASIWSTVAEMYRLNTPKVGRAEGPRVSRGACAAMVTKVARLLRAAKGTDSSRYRDQRNHKIRQCMDQATPAVAKCVGRARKAADLAQCDPTTVRRRTAPRKATPKSPPAKTR